MVKEFKTRPEITPEEYYRNRFLETYFPRISKIKWFLVKLFGKKKVGYSGIAREYMWAWYEFKGKRYYAVCKDFRGEVICKRI